MNRTSATRVALLAASSLSAVVLAAPVAAQGAASGTGLTIENAPAIISNNTINPNTAAPAGSLDAGVTGVGQMIGFYPNAAGTGAGLGLCTGTLINPRTVIFAAHCVNANPAHRYGSATGTGGGVVAGTPLATTFGTTNGIPLSFGFEATNRCTGTATAAGNGCLSGTGPYEKWRDSRFGTQTGSHIYNVNQIWYDPRSLAPNSNGFLEADVALATLDTPAFNVPTWTMLFTPLTGQTHALSTGYGINGTSATGQSGPGCPASTSTVCGSIDYRRRMVENTLSALGSLQDRNAFLYGSGSAGTLLQSVYMLDFDSPGGEAEFNTATGKFDFDLFNGAALPREGTTAGGDSGGPLIVDQKFDKPVMVGVLSGGSRFYNGQRFSTYGTHSFYQPLFLFWDMIVANNPYVYAGAVAGDGDWEDPTHWTQAMDPNYAIEVDGALVNSLPDTSALGVSGSTVKFGEVCFLANCTNLANDDTATPPPVGNGSPLVIAGGPGTNNFVPDNVNPVNNANPALSVKARYFDVTLSEAGTTTLSSTRTIDVLTIDGNASKLNIANAGKLNVFGEFNQWQGWTQVDGLLQSGGDSFIGSGILSGTGTLKAPFVTVAAGIVAPGGGDKIGKLTIDGNAVLSSGSSLFVDIARGKADLLAVTGTLSLSSTATDGASIVFNKVTDAPAPRHGDKITVATAGGNIQGTFGKAYTFQGVLRPHLTYLDSTSDADTVADKVEVELRAGSLVEILDGGSPIEIAFASALDQLRNGFYGNLSNLYGAIDWMNPGQLSATFNAMTPSIVGETTLLQDRQSRQLIGNVSDRLSLLGTGQANGISFSGTAGGFAENRQSMSAPAQLGLTSGGAVAATTGGLSGFVSMSSDRVRSSYGNARQASAGQHSRYFASGIEAPLGDARVGTAVGYAEAVSNAGSDQARSTMTQAAAYASMPVGKSGYVGGILAAERARTVTNRVSTDAASMINLNGEGHSNRYMATAEAGLRKSLGSGLSLNPRAQLGISRYSLSGLTERGGESALSLDKLAVNRIETRFGAKLQGETSINGWTARPNLQADYVRLLSGAKNGMLVSFALAPEHSFALPLTNGGSGWMEMKGGVELSKGKFSLGLSGQATAGDAPISDQRGAIDLTFRF